MVISDGLNLAKSNKSWMLMLSLLALWMWHPARALDVIDLDPSSPREGRPFSAIVQYTLCPEFPDSSDDGILQNVTVEDDVIFLDVKMADLPVIPTCFGPSPPTPVAMPSVPEGAYTIIVSRVEADVVFPANPEDRQFRSQFSFIQGPPAAISVHTMSTGFILALTLLMLMFSAPAVRSRC